MTAGEPDVAPVAVLVADSHAVVRAGLRLLIEREEDLRVAGEATSVETAESLTRRRHPDVLLFDLHLPGDALGTVHRLHKTLPGLGIVAFSAAGDVAAARAALGAGASAFVHKAAAREEVIAAVRSAATGSRYLDPGLGAQLLEDPPTGDCDGLTTREREVLRLVALGHTNAEVAARLFLSVRTVEAHRAQLQHRLGLHTRHELVLHALRRGLLTEDEPV